MDSEMDIVWPPISKDCDMLGFWLFCTTSSFCVLSLRHCESVKFVMISFCLATDCVVVAQVLTSSAWTAAPIKVLQTDRPQHSVVILSRSLSMTVRNKDGENTRLMRMRNYVLIEQRGCACEWSVAIVLPRFPEGL